ncbi:MAG TPA: ATP synthase F0 subunit B [Ilumatobacter sp.]|nr:ATP synthase F0 subunit B [Ilumatobacter sp.]
MITVHVTQSSGGGFQISFPRTAGDEATEDAEAHEEEVDEGPSPIAPEVKELLWGFGAFFVFFILMRVWLFPKVRKGMEARYGLIRGEHENADSIRSAANRDVAEYQAALAEVRAEATARIDAARAQLEQVRAERLADVNGHIAERRAAAVAEAEAAHAAARGQIEVAVADVATRAAHLTVGREPDSNTVRQAVTTVMGGGE